MQQHLPKNLTRASALWGELLVEERGFYCFSTHVMFNMSIKKQTNQKTNMSTSWYTEVTSVSKL